MRIFRLVSLKDDTDWTTNEPPSVMLKPRILAFPAALEPGMFFEAVLSMSYLTVRASWIATLLVGLGGCARPEALDAQAVRIESAAILGATQSTVYTGLAYPQRRADLAFSGGGTLDATTNVVADGQTRPLQVGDRIAKGTVLAQLRAADLRSQNPMASGMAASAAAAQQRAHSEFRKAQNLFAEGVISKAQFDSAKAQYRAVGAATGGQGGRLASGESKLVAPFEGTILSQTLEPGGTAQPGVPVISIGDVSVMCTSFPVGESVQKTVRVGEKVVVTPEVSGAANVYGSVHKISSLGEGRASSYEVEVCVDNKAGLMRSGTPMRVHLAQAAEDAAKVSVAVRSVVSDPNKSGYAVYVLNDEKGAVRATLRAVTLGRLSRSRVTIEAGLRPGERYVTQGAANLADGQEVVILR
jgi:RND family efflux transporter MFP subunit